MSHVKIYFLLVSLFSLLNAELIKPSDLVLKALSSSEVSIKWKDNSKNEIGYKIFIDGKLIKITSANTTSFIDKNLLPSHTYRYTVKATDDAVAKVYISALDFSVDDVYHNNQVIYVKNRNELIDTI